MLSTIIFGFFQWLFAVCFLFCFGECFVVDVVFALTERGTSIFMWGARKCTSTFEWQ